VADRDIQRFIESNRTLGDHAPTSCDECGATETKLQRCGRCRLSWYRSSSCQRLAWPKHKEFCFDAAKAKTQVVGEAAQDPEKA
jgi:hypothetical protein